MPIYEYLCEECCEEFSVRLSLAAYEAGDVLCPKCGSHKVTRQFSVFFAQTSKKS